MKLRKTLILIAVLLSLLLCACGANTESVEDPAPDIAVAPTAKPTPNPEPTPSQKPEKVYSGMWGEKFAEKFTDEEVIVTENSYQSENVNITVERFEENSIIYFVADIYVRDLSCLRTGFARGGFREGSEQLVDLAESHNALLAITGDHPMGRGSGVVIRNGEVYQESRYMDVCVMLKDGSMFTMTDAELDIEELKAMDPYQVWSFGPELLDEEGKAKTSFNSIVTRATPRCAIGYVEPGHYYFVEVDGRITESRGMSMEALAQLFESLGCVSAYNLDGGQSSAIVWQGELLSYPYGRPLSDMIYIIDEVQEEEN